MTSPLDDVAAALVAAEEHVASITAERDALLARVNELDDEVARLVGERDDARAEVERMREALRESELTSEMRSRREGAALVELSKVEGDLDRAERKLEEVVSTSAPGVGGASLAATAMALELVAECWNALNDGIGVTFDGLLRDRARELREASDG